MLHRNFLARHFMGWALAALCAAGIGLPVSAQTAPASSAAPVAARADGQPLKILRYAFLIAETTLTPHKCGAWRGTSR